MQNKKMKQAIKTGAGIKRKSFALKAQKKNSKKMFIKYHLC